MTRKFKVIGLALVAVLAMSAVVASSASATEFTAASYPVALSGSQPEGALHEFEVGSGNVKCTTATFTGTGSAATTTQTITPHYTGCTAFGLSATVTLNGCDYLFHSQASGLNGTVDIVCSGSNEIKIDTAGGLCDTHVKPQTGLGGITFANNGNHIDVTAKVTTIHAVVTGKFLCPVTTSTKTYTDSKYTGTVTLKGDNGATKIDVG